jgi:hypothetical protein
MNYESFHSEITELADALDYLFHALLLHQIGVDAKILCEVITDSVISRRVKDALQNVGLSVNSANSMP